MPKLTSWAPRPAPRWGWGRPTAASQAASTPGLTLPPNFREGLATLLRLLPPATASRTLGGGAHSTLSGCWPTPHVGPTVGAKSTHEAAGVSVATALAPGFP